MRCYSYLSLILNVIQIEKIANFISERDSIECSGQSFHVNDGRGQSVFQASRDEVKVFSDTFVVDGVGGLAVKNAVQTPILKAPYGSDLL